MKQLRLLPVIALAVVSYFSSCQKEIYFERAADNVNDTIPAGPGPQDTALNTWRFTDHTNGSVHYGIIDTIATKLEINPLWNYLIIKGWPVRFGSVSDDTLFLIALFLPNPFIEPGNYNITSGTGGEHIFGYGNNTIMPPYGSNQNFCYYLATPDIAPDFVIKIISYDSERRIVKGSFSGAPRRRASISDYSITFHPISGSFYFKLN